MKQLYEEAELLVEEAKKISCELWKYTPSLEQSDQVPLPAIAYSIAGLMYKLAALRIDILKKEKENEI